MYDYYYAARAVETTMDKRTPVTAYSARRFARSVRSPLEMDARPTASLEYRGAVTPSADFSVRVEAEAGGGTVAATRINRPRALRSHQAAVWVRRG